MQKHIADQKVKEEEERKRKFEAQQHEAKQSRQVNEQIERLKKAQQERARNVLRELSIRGVKQIGKEKITKMESSEKELDYENIMAFYANVLKKDREAFELNKTKKTNDVEIWTRAKKEEEKAAMEAFCQQHGQTEIQ